MDQRKALLILLFFALWLQGCVLVFPVPSSKEEILSGKKITKEELTFIQEGMTSKNEVIERLGPPSVIWKKANILAYDCVSKWGDLYVIAVVGAVGGVGGFGGGGSQQLAETHILLIQFDENDLIKRFEKISIAGSDHYGNLLEKWVNKPIEPVDKK
jgi:hypothetical protein